MTRLVVLALVVMPLWPRIVERNRALLARIEAFERRVDQEAVIGRTLRPHAQWLLTRWLGAGNERVYPGHESWLFYRPDVEYVTGSGFLEERQVARRIASTSEWQSLPQPNPLPALVRFHADLSARGIALVLMPTPVKPVVHPERLSAGLRGPIRNASYREFAAALDAAGIAVFDPADDLSRGTTDRYLRTDTHWRPEAMEVAAERLARFVEARWPAAPGGASAYRVERLEIRQTGDIVPMLDLANQQRLYPPESVWLRRIVNADGSTWRSSRDADVLVLGDSFSNIYSLESMGWGTSAGFVEHLSYALRRPVDRIVQNDQAAFATREMLARDLDRLKTTRVVVYQFAERELAFGDWRILPLK